MIFQKRVADGIIDLVFQRAMLKAIHFDIQFCAAAKEIQDIGPDWMLPPEFIPGETPVTQPRPHQPLTP